METETITQDPTVPTEKASRWEDFVDIFFSPAELFRRRAHESWAIPMVVVAVLSTIVYFGFPSVNRAFAEAQIAQMVAKRPELAERMAGQTPGAGIQNIIGGVILPLAITLFVVLSAFFTWLAAKVTGVDLTWRRALLINAWLGMIGVLAQLAVYVVAFLKVNQGEALHPLTDRSVGVAHFMNAESTNPVVLALLGRIDLFAFWTLLVMAIALTVVAAAPKAKAYATATIVWFAIALPFLVGAAFT